jgi:hypothetical protein
VVPLPGGAEQARACVESIFRSGAVGRVFTLAGAADPALRQALVELQDRHPALVVLGDESPQSFVRSCNLGIVLRERHVALLDPESRPADGWLEEMLAVLESSDRIASVTSAASASESPPRSSELQAAAFPCLLLRHAVINMIGAFDPALAHRDDALDDWSMRAQGMGLRHLRANRAAVWHPGGGEDRDARSAELLHARHPHHPQQLQPPPEPAGPAQVRVDPIESLPDLRRLLEHPGPLVIRIDDPQRAAALPLLLAAAHAAQVVVAPSDAVRHRIISELALAPQSVVTVPRDAGLAQVLEAAAARPDQRSQRLRRALARLARG